MKTNFKFGICEWLLPIPGPISFNMAAELGYDGVQILDWGGRENNYPLNLDWVQDSFRKYMEENGIMIQTLQLAYESWLDYEGTMNLYEDANGCFKLCYDTLNPLRYHFGDPLAELCRIPETPEEEEWLSKQNFHNSVDDAYTG